MHAVINTRNFIFAPSLHGRTHVYRQTENKREIRRTRADGFTLTDLWRPRCRRGWGRSWASNGTKVQQVVQGQRWEQQQGVGVTAGSAGKDNQGGAELSTALKEATRRRNLTLQLRHTQHCLAIVFVIQFQLSNFIS